MSQLDSPRLHFAGYFQADVSTVNNDVRYYDVQAFRPEYQQLSLSGGGGAWNPEGTGVFRLVNCEVTGAVLDGGLLFTQGEDPVIGMSIQNADGRAPGKIVDLDPQQQMVSTIWGMGVRLTNGLHPALFAGDYAPAAFTNLWMRQQTGVLMDQKMAACYGSVLSNVRWDGHADSRVLAALARAGSSGQLSIQLNVYGYGRDPSIPRYTLGHVTGTIGPHRAGEPQQFAIGRQLAPQGTANPMVPSGGVYYFTCKVDPARKRVTADFGNCLPIVDANRGLQDIGALVLGVLRRNPTEQLASIAMSEVVVLGPVAYRQTGWYRQTAGIQDFPYAAIDGAAALIDDHALVLVRPNAAGEFDVLVQETLGGLYVRADDCVVRLDPGKSAGVALYASRYGHPLPGAAVVTSVNTGFMGGTGAGNQPLHPPVKTPQIGTPADAITYPASLTTDATGVATLAIAAGPSGPGNPRGYIDGQLYGIGYQLGDPAAQTPTNQWDFISVLAFSPTDVPAQPTWCGQIEPIFQQYGNLYPIMSKHLVDLGNYDSVVEHRRILRLAFSLPRADPNHMPVTRDLSDAKRDMILDWLDGPPGGGPPVKGTPVARAAVAPAAAAPTGPSVALEPLQTGGKTAVILEHQARQAEKGRKP